MKNPEALTFRIPKGMFRPVTGKLYLYLYICTPALNVAALVPVIFEPPFIRSDGASQHTGNITAVTRDRIVLSQSIEYTGSGTAHLPGPLRNLETSTRWR